MLESRRQDYCRKRRAKFVAFQNIERRRRRRRTLPRQQVTWWVTCRHVTPVSTPSEAAAAAVPVIPRSTASSSLFILNISTSSCLACDWSSVDWRLTILAASAHVSANHVRQSSLRPSGLLTCKRRVDREVCWFTWAYIR